MTNRRKILLSIMGVVTLLLITIRLSYAYFTANLAGGEETTTITVTGGIISIVYSGDASINIANIIPSDDPILTKTFTVTGNNTTDIEMKYQLSLVVESNTFSENALKYKLIGINNNNNGTTVPNQTELTNIGTSSKIIELGIGEFISPTEGNKVHTYNLELYFPNKDEPQNEDQEREIKAYVEIKEYVPIFLNEYIIRLADNSETTEVYNENGYRYQGLNPNNYVRFNNELWRIIGVFDEETHGIGGENLVKIIKSNLLNKIAWSNSNYNNWSSASLRSYLNGVYQSGIAEASKNIIQEVTWRLGGHPLISAGAASFYMYERGTSVSSGNPISLIGNIGLMYPSDYGYAVPSHLCARTLNLNNYSNNNCKNNNWLLDTVNKQWTLTPIVATGGQYHVYNVHYLGTLPNDYAEYIFAVRPTLYLKSNTNKIRGEGTEENPYIIVME